MKKIKKISWIENNFDMEYDRSSAIIEQEWGNKGLGGIVFGLCFLAVLLPGIPTLIQVIKGTGKGNPLGALIALLLIFIWPLYWGINQFFLLRRIEFFDTVIKITIRSILRSRKYEMNIRDYNQLEFGRSESRSRAKGGRTGRYFLHLPHKNRNLTIVLYENIQKPLEEERMKAYSKKLNLPLVNITPERLRRDIEFKKKIETVLSERKQDL